MAAADMLLPAIGDPANAKSSHWPSGDTKKLPGLPPGRESVSLRTGPSVGVAFRAFTRGNATATTATSPKVPAISHGSLERWNARYRLSCVARQVLDRKASIADVVQALLGIAHEGVGEQPAESGRRVRRQGGPVRIARQDLGQRVRAGVARERDAAGQHFIQHAAERPDVRALVDGLTARLFGAHVGRRAHDRSLTRSVVSDRRHCDQIGAAESPVVAFARPKSSTLTTPSGVTLMLAGFRSRWTMPLLVRRFQRLGDLARDGQGFVQRQRARGLPRRLRA